MATIPLVLVPIPADQVQSAINALIGHINDFLSGNSPSDVNITGGTINGTTIGQTTPAAGSFTSLTATSGSINGSAIVTLTAAQTLTNKILTSPVITGGTLNNAVIGGVTPAAITGTTITANTGFTGNLTGNASTATALATGRTIAITGDLAYTSPAFDGTGNVTAAGTLATVNGNVGSFGSSTAIPSFTVNAKGLITAASTNAVIAPAGTLTGNTLAAGVTASSLTSVGTLTGGATGAGFTVALATSTITGILTSANGGTGNGFTKFTGPTTSEKTFTLPNASATLAIAATGSWTPVVTFATPGDLSITYTTQFGYYARAGNLIFLTFLLSLNTFTYTTASGALQITGLPFTSENISGSAGIGNAQFSGITKAGYTQVVPQVAPNSATVVFFASGSAVARAAVNAADMPSGGAVILFGTVVYPITP